MFGQGGTPLHDAAANGHEKEVEEMLAQSRFDINRKDNAGRTAFFVACKYGRLNTAKALARAGADVKAADAQGNSAYTASQGLVKEWLNRYKRTRRVSATQSYHNTSEAHRLHEERLKKESARKGIQAAARRQARHHHPDGQEEHPHPHHHSHFKHIHLPGHNHHHEAETSPYNQLKKEKPEWAGRVIHYSVVFTPDMTHAVRGKV